MSRLVMSAIVASLMLNAAHAEELRYKQRLLGDLVKEVPGILKTYDPATGRFGSGIWICNDQQVMWPLAVAYATPGQENPYHRDPKLLDAIMKAGDALIEDMNPKGQWMFRKKDGSTWGYTHMCWTYSRWIRSFGLIRDQMPPERRERWAKALMLGYGEIAKSAMGRIHNIPTHHAMGLYAAGKIFERPEWCQTAADFMTKVMAEQQEGGYWAEGGGPVILYGFVYVESLGTYYAMSHDETVLPALVKAAEFHRQFTYPDGQNVETIDQRNPFHEGLASGNVGFTLSPGGRAYLLNQWNRRQWQLDSDLIASLLCYGEEGPGADLPPADKQQVFVLREQGVERAATVRRGRWFVCLSAYTTPVATNRWHQDRQNFVSIFHDRAGVLLGGGNTKLQPAWSNFAVVDTNLLAHKPGDENPKFLPPKDTLFHVPTAARLFTEPEPGLELSYGPETCRIRVRIKDDRVLEYEVESTANSTLGVTAHVTLMPHLKQPLETGGGRKLKLGPEPVALGSAELGPWLSHAGWRLQVPEGAGLRWPVLPHNPYRKDGRAEAAEGRIVVQVPLDRQHARQQFVIEVQQ